MKSTGEVLGIDETFARRAAQGVSWRPACACREAADAFSSRSPTRRSTTSVPCCDATRRSGTRWSRRPERAPCSKRPGIATAADQQDRRRLAARARSHRVARRRPRHQRCERRAGNLRQLQDSPRGGRSEYRVFDESGHGASAGGGARKHGRPAAQPARVPQRASRRSARRVADLPDASLRARAATQHAGGRQLAARGRRRDDHRRAASAGVDAARRRDRRGAGRTPACARKGLLRLDRPHVSAGRRARVRRLGARPRAARSHRLGRAASRGASTKSSVLNVEDFPTTSPTRSRSPPARARAVRRLPAALRARRLRLEREAALRVGLPRASVRQARTVARTGRTRSVTSKRCRRARTSRRRCSTSCGVEVVLASTRVDESDRARGDQRRARRRSRPPHLAVRTERRLHGAARDGQ